MTYEEIVARLTETFRDVFDDESIVLLRETTANDIEDWDSLSHVGLIVAIEKEFKVRFSLVELKPLKSVGDLLDLIQTKAN